jgi:hypothetical protein
MPTKYERTDEDQRAGNLSYLPRRGHVCSLHIKSKHESSVFYAALYFIHQTTKGVSPKLSALEGGVAITSKTCVQEVLDSNISRDTGHLDRFSTVPPYICEGNISVRPRRRPSTLRISNSLLNGHRTIQCCKVRDIVSVVK